MQEKENVFVKNICCLKVDVELLKRTALENKHQNRPASHFWVATHRLRITDLTKEWVKENKDVFLPHSHIVVWFFTGR